MRRAPGVQVFIRAFGIHRILLDPVGLNQTLAEKSRPALVPNQEAAAKIRTRVAGAPIGMISHVGEDKSHVKNQ